MKPRIIGLARRPVSCAPMETMKAGLITLKEGMFGDCKGSKFPERQVTILAIEDWQAALRDLPDHPALDWTVRRANVLVEGLRLPRGLGSIISLRDCMLRVTAQTSPCSKMEAAYPGLLKALSPQWRGGVTCKVLTGGPVALDDHVKILLEQPEHLIRLPT